MNDMKNILVSVIVPCYNQAEFLEESLNSVLHQTYVNWECIIINDGSTDNTEEVALIFCDKDRRFTYYKKDNEGLSAARNVGLKFAKGDYIQFLDSDDILLPNKFKSQIDILDGNNEIDINICRYKLFTEKIEKPYDSPFTLAKFDCSLDGLLYLWGETFTFPPICYFVRKSFLEKHSIIFKENLNALEDWFFLVEMNIKGAYFMETEECLALYRKHDRNMSGDFSKMFKALLETSILLVEILPSEIKVEYSKKISKIIMKRFNNHVVRSTAVRKANSIDYKLGFMLLSPFRKIYNYLKKSTL